MIEAKIKIKCEKCKVELARGWALRMFTKDSRNPLKLAKELVSFIVMLFRRFGSEPMCYQCKQKIFDKEERAYKKRKARRIQLKELRQKPQIYF